MKIDCYLYLLKLLLWLACFPNNEKTKLACFSNKDKTKLSRFSNNDKTKLGRLTGDEVLEVNGLRVKGKSVHDICDTLCQMTGTLTFVIVPGPGAANAATANAVAVTGASVIAAAAKEPDVPETVVSCYSFWNHQGPYFGKSPLYAPLILFEHPDWLENIEWPIGVLQISIS